MIISVSQKKKKKNILRSEDASSRMDQEMICALLQPKEKSPESDVNHFHRRPTFLPGHMTHL